MNFLKHAKSYKQLEIKQLKAKQRKNRFTQMLHEKKHVLIAEIKIKSPSSEILLKTDPIVQVLQYEKNKVDAISVVTDTQSFGGSLDLLKNIRQSTRLPLFRKDFIMDKSQLVESLLSGSDAVLLIAKLVSRNKLKELINFSYELGLLPVVEISHKNEIKKVLQTGGKIIGVNSRNLVTLSVDLDNALEIIRILPQPVIPLLFSGIQTKHDVDKAFKAGAKGVLVGTSLLQTTNIREKIKEFNI